MKIFCILSTSSLTGGSSKSFLDYCTRLAKRNDVEVIVTVPCKGPVYNILQQNNVKTEIIPVRFNIYPNLKGLKSLLTPIVAARNYIHNYKSYRQMLQCIKKHSPDIICTNVSVVNVGYKVARELSIPHIYHIREFQDKDFGMRIIPSKKGFIKTLQNSYSICITKGIQAHFQQQNNPKSRVIYDGISTTDTKTYEKEKYFLFVGRLSTSKGIQLILNAFKTYCQEANSYNLLLAGSADTANTELELKRFCSDSGINDRVCFLGPRNDINQLMQKAYAVIVASEFEAFGRVTAEAMFNRTLVIGRNTTGTKEQFDNGVEITNNEIGLRFNTEEELVERMHYATFLSTKQYEELTQRARIAVEQLYTPEKCSAAIYELFKSIKDSND